MPASPSQFTLARPGGPRGTAAGSTARRLVATAGMLAAAAAVLTSASAAGASVRAAFWVAASGTPTGANTSCQTAAYSTVQSAVTAAEAAESAHPYPVPTVEICPGTYAEQVTILQSLVLTRAPVAAHLGPVTIQLPASVGSDQSTGLSTTNCQANDSAGQVPQSVIEICAAGSGGANTTGTRVSIRHVTVEGQWPNSVCNDSLYGILVEGGASLSLTESTVEKMGAYPLNGCQGGVGVQVGFAPTGQIGHAYLAGDVINTYQKNGVTIDGSNSSAAIARVVVTGAGPTSQIAQNGIQVSWGATGSVTHSTITGNNYTGTGVASSTGILAFGGGGTVCGIGAGAPLVRHARFFGNRLRGNDIGIALYNLDSTCTTSAPTATFDTVCGNSIRNSNGYPGGVASADANITGFDPTTGYQAGVTDVGNHDVVCFNSIHGAGYRPRDATSSLPNPPPPAFVRPVDIVSGPAIHPLTFGNTFDGSPYLPDRAVARSAGRTNGALGHRVGASRQHTVVLPLP